MASFIHEIDPGNSETFRRTSPGAVGQRKPANANRISAPIRSPPCKMPLLRRLQPAVTSRLACLYRKPAMLPVLLAFGHASGLALKNIKRHMIKEQQTLTTGLAMHFHPYSIAHSVLHRYRRAVVKCRRNLHDRRDRSWTPLSACAGRHRSRGAVPFEGRGGHACRP